jgi:hypothetical protein
LPTLAHALALASLIALAVWIASALARAPRVQTLAQIVTFTALAFASLAILLIPPEPGPREIRPCFIALGLPMCLAQAWLSWRIDRR